MRPLKGEPLRFERDPARRVPPPGDPAWEAAQAKLDSMIAELRQDTEDPNGWIRDAAGAWFDGRHGESYDLASPAGSKGAFGTLTPFGDHVSLELHGLSRAEVERILQTLRTGY